MLKLGCSQPAAPRPYLRLAELQTTLEAQAETRNKTSRLLCPLAKAPEPRAERTAKGRKRMPETRLPPILSS